MNCWKDTAINQPNRCLVFLVFCLVLFSVTKDAQAQVKDSVLIQQYYLNSLLINNEIVPHVKVPMITVMPPVKFKNKRQRRRYSRLEYNLRKVYPYSRTIKYLFMEINAVLDTIPEKKRRKAYIKTREEELKNQFERKLKKLTYTQGRLLIKLINRETGHTTYEVVKELKGSFNAFFWQSLASVFGSSLKAEYDPKGDDWMMEHIIRRLEMEYY